MDEITIVIDTATRARLHEACVEKAQRAANKDEKIEVEDLAAMLANAEYDTVNYFNA